MKCKVFFIFLFVGILNLFGQVNAGGNRIICGVDTVLHGTGTSGATFNWTIVSKPSGASDPIFSNSTILEPTVSGMNTPGPYTFRVTQNLSGQITTSDVTITSTGDVSSFSAGNDITTISATTGIATLSGTIPNGYTASWSYYNISDWERYSNKTTTNATMSNVNVANPKLELINKVNHNIDPAYRAVLRITSIYNPNCWYEDDVVVRFIPNEKLVFNATYNMCYSSTTSDRYIGINSNSPIFATDLPNASGNPAFGTTVSVNVISQPSSGNISFKEIRGTNLYFNGVNIIGTYVFTITISNANGTYTTPQITYSYNGTDPNPVSFIDSAYPEQMQVYSPGNSGGIVYCNKEGSLEPITFYFKINSLDSPSVTTRIGNRGIVPPGGSPTLVLNGSGTMNRSVVATPPVGGWRVGTYVVYIDTGDGVCSRTQSFYIHISDGNRKDVKVDDLAVCYPGSGIVDATIQLPEIYKGVINSSYLQSFSGGYEFSLISKPNGASNPTYDPSNLRTFTNTSTTIGNLDKEGEYVFKIKAVGIAGGIDPGFIDKEYACSGALYEDTFSIFVSKKVGSNAGADYTVYGETTTILNGNDPGVANGIWSLISKPNGVVDPTIVNPNSYNTEITGLEVGKYKFSWTITTGECSDSSEVEITVVEEACTNPAIGGTPDGYTNVGITTQTKQQVWPENIPNGFLALESNTKGMVITRVQNSTKITEPKEGMIIYNIDAKCVQLYNGSVWKCIKNTCDPVVESPRKIKIGSFASYTIGSGQFPAYDSQLTNVSNYGPTGTFKGVTGFEFSDLPSTTLTNSTGSQLKSNYDIINTGYSSITPVQAQNVADFVKEGGVAIINLDTSSAYNFNPILTAFGISGSNGIGA
ncbi:MAG: hypothetical protein ACRC8Z_02335, partial [Empedobacter falsenii]